MMSFLNSTLSYSWKVIEKLNQNFLHVSNEGLSDQNGNNSVEMNLKFDYSEDKKYFELEEFQMILEDKKSLTTSLTNIFSNRRYLKLKDKQELVKFQLEKFTWTTQDFNLEYENRVESCYILAFEEACRTIGILNDLNVDAITSANLQFYNLIVSCLEDKYALEDSKISIILHTFNKIYKLLDSINKTIKDHDISQHEFILKYRFSISEKIFEISLLFSNLASSIIKSKDKILEDKKIFYDLFLTEKFVEDVRKKLESLNQDFSCYINKLREIYSNMNKLDDVSTEENTLTKLDVPNLKIFIKRLCLHFNAVNSIFEYYLKMRNFNKNSWYFSRQHNHDFAFAASNLGLDLYMLFIDFMNVPNYYNRLEKNWGIENIQLWCTNHLEDLFEKDQLLSYNEDDIQHMIFGLIKDMKVNLLEDIRQTSCSISMLKNFNDKILALKSVKYYLKMNPSQKLELSQRTEEVDKIKKQYENSLIMEEETDKQNGNLSQSTSRLPTGYPKKFTSKNIRSPIGDDETSKNSDIREESFHFGSSFDGNIFGGGFNFNIIEGDLADPQGASNNLKMPYDNQAYDGPKNKNNSSGNITGINFQGTSQDHMKPNVNSHVVYKDNGILYGSGNATNNQIISGVNHALNDLANKSSRFENNSGVHLQGNKQNNNLKGVDTYPENKNIEEHKISSDFTTLSNKSSEISMIVYILVGSVLGCIIAGCIYLLLYIKKPLNWSFFKGTKQKLMSYEI